MSPSNLPTFKALVIDMDGVLWRGDTPLPGLLEFFETLVEMKLPFVLATNNAMKVAAEYTEKLAGFGVEVNPDRILTSSEATASFIKHHYPEVDTVYAVGEAGLHRALLEQNLRVIGPEEVRNGETAPLVVLGLAREALSYELLAMGSLLLHKGAALVATNADPTYPTELGPLPGAGAVLAVLTTASGATPTVVGKPNLAMFEEALRRLGSRPEDTLMVGDRLGTDIKGGGAAGMKTVLLMSGVSSRDDLTASKVQPDLVMVDIRELTSFLKANLT